MARLHLVRHGRAAAGWDADVDPGLDAEGSDQAEEVAETLARTLVPRRVVSSPLRRARETASPLAARWGGEVQLEPAFGEIPSPTTDLAERGRWLEATLRSTWATVDTEVRAWRAALVAAALAQPADVVVFTHFVAINAVVATATGAAEVTTFLPGNASVTVIDAYPESGRLQVVTLGGEARTAVG